MAILDKNLIIEELKIALEQTQDDLYPLKSSINEK